MSRQAAAAYEQLARGMRRQRRVWLFLAVVNLATALVAAHRHELVTAVFASAAIGAGLMWTRAAEAAERWSAAARLERGQGR